VIRMNDECLKLRDHTAGYQTVEDIQAVVGEAIGLHKKPLADDDYIDEAMVRAGPAAWSRRTRACRGQGMPSACGVDELGGHSRGGGGVPPNKAERLCS